MTYKERLLVILRFLRLYWLRFVIGALIAVAVVLFLCNLGNIISWFCTVMGKTVKTDDVYVEEKTKVSEISEGKNSSISESSESPELDWRSNLPKIYAVENSGLFSEFGFVSVGRFFGSFKLLEINRKLGFVIYEDSEFLYRVGFSGSADRVRKTKETDSN